MAAPDPVRQKLQTRAGLLECETWGAGSPCIVLFNGAGMTLDSWTGLRPQVDRLGTVFAWNRFGAEGSDAPRLPQTGAVVTASLRELLKYAGMAPPYVLVGHSLGALYADLFARLHPHEVAGVLFIAPVREPDPGALLEREEEFARSLGKVQGVAADRIGQNLHAEIEAVDDLVREVAAAGAWPAVPVATLAGRGRGHFPQLDDPGSVLRELEGVLRRVCAGQEPGRRPTLGA